MCHAWTDVSSKHISSNICTHRHPGKGQSEWTKAKWPVGTGLSLPVSSLQTSVCRHLSMETWLLMELSLLGRQTAPLYTKQFTKVTSCRSMHVSDMNLAEQSFQSFGERGREEQWHDTKKWIWLTYICLIVSWVIRPRHGTMRQEGGQR